MSAVLPAPVALAVAHRGILTGKSWSALLGAIIVVFIQKRPQGIFAMKGRSAEA